MHGRWWFAAVACLPAVGCGAPANGTSAGSSGGTPPLSATGGATPLGTTGGQGQGGGPGISVPTAGGSGAVGTAGTAGDCSGDDCQVGCGNGIIDPGLDEACDDGNIVSGDGCTADCRSVEKDHACLEPGMPCSNLVACGDGRLMGMETCDDGNAVDGDGCSALCALENGWDCPAPGSACAPRCGDGILIAAEECEGPNLGLGCTALCQLEPGFACDPPSGVTPASCHLTTCGDGVREGSEACDDGNAIDGDGCSGACAFEPDCAAGTCTTRCGDGIRLSPEECDDGNTDGGDGCSADCGAETGFSCEDDASAPPDELNLEVTYRDFNSFPIGGATRHPDFESDWQGVDVTPGLVLDTLDADGKPEMAGRCDAASTAGCPDGQMLTTAANFAAWYRDSTGVNAVVPGTLLLRPGAGGAYAFDSGNRGFYPIDQQGFTAAPASESEWQADPNVNDGGQHDFGFTTEIRYFFQYAGGESLTFSGDDDLWVFINRRLALDVGGLHPRVARTLMVDASATELGLALGGLYEIVLFHAERHSAASNFSLTLTGFVPSKSLCEATCGDGIVAASEACDLGSDMNTGSYGGCTPDCRRGPYCGDGVAQAPEEACDDGLNVTPYASVGGSGCAPGCVPSGMCGDGVIDSLFGEECDAGPTPPPNSPCSSECRLGARCGDGIVQPEIGEQCDDGNTLSGDSCNRNCQIRVP